MTSQNYTKLPQLSCHSNSPEVKMTAICIAALSGEEGKDELFANDAAKTKVVSETCNADQKKVDTALLKAVEAVPILKQYLNAKFSLFKVTNPTR
eukprot:13336188-Ditylum_brightwellii.AAC.1